MKRKPVKQVAKPHRILLQAIVNALHVIFTEAKYADKVIEKTLKENPKLPKEKKEEIQMRLKYVSLNFEEYIDFLTKGHDIR